jgi:hypothetical protein
MLISERLATTSMTTDQQFDFLANRIEGILKLLALQTASGKKAGEAAALLERAGLDRKTIAEILNTSPDSVRALLSQNKKGSSEKKSKKAEVEPTGTEVSASAVAPAEEVQQ